MRIVQYPHPALKRPTTPVNGIDAGLRRAIGQMFQLMYDARGLGLAANQVALPYRMLVMNVKGDPQQPDQERVYLNPRIVQRQGVVDASEGCLSFPGLYAPVKRAKSVVVEAFDERGEPVTVRAAGLEARAWQHELDHLDGTVFIERFGPLVRLARTREVRAFERSFRQQQEAGAIPSDVEIEKLLRDLEQALGPTG